MSNLFLLKKKIIYIVFYLLRFMYYQSILNITFCIILKYNKNYDEKQNQHLYIKK